MQGSEIMSVIARQKFNSIIDVQLMVKRSRSVITGLNRSQQLELLTQKKLSSYRTRVRKYYHYLLDRRNQLVMELKVLAITGDKGMKGSLAYGERNT